MMKYSMPSWPFCDTGRKWALRDGNMVPTANVAVMLGLSALHWVI